MGIVRTTEQRRAELEEFYRQLVGAVHPEKWRKRSKDDDGEGEEEEMERLVCVTSGISFLGLAIVNRLLSRGYSVRIALESQDDVERLRAMEIFGSSENFRVSAVLIKMGDLQSLCEAFQGCVAVFHTSSFLDPAGLSGYSKHMVELESDAAAKVVEACARTESVKKCVFTSSLLACVWQDIDDNDHSDRATIDESDWSDESHCVNKKLWLALGKTRAEKTAWRVAREEDVKLATICPALIVGPQFRQRNSTSSLAYLKGVGEMFQKGLLAIVDVGHVAEAHVRVYEAMATGARGRFVCFDRVIRQAGDAIELVRPLGLPDLVARESFDTSPIGFQLCNSKLSTLMSSISRCNPC